jgi:SAM-dependent methyltransferase
MDESERPEVVTGAAGIYESILVPAIFDACVPRLLDLGQVQSGDRVLDVACGTGIVSRHAVERVGPRGNVVGLDLAPAMIEVAKSVEPAVDWRIGNAMELPFPNESFDVVLCQAGLMFFPDRVEAVKEMKRVLRPNGRLAILVWGHSDGQEAFATLIEQRGNQKAADSYRTPWAMTDPDELQAAVANAGLDDVEVHVEPCLSQYPSIEDFATSTAILLGDHLDRPYVMRIADEAFAPFTTDSGGVHIPGLMNIAAAKRQ